MTIATILTPIDPLATDETVAEALVQMAEEHVGHLPVVAPDGSLDALVSETALRMQDPEARALQHGTCVCGRNPSCRAPSPRRCPTCCA